jgi:hypothetical protein
MLNSARIAMLIYKPYNRGGVSVFRLTCYHRASKMRAVE